MLMITIILSIALIYPVHCQVSSYSALCSGASQDDYGNYSYVTKGFAIVRDDLFIMTISGPIKVKLTHPPFEIDYVESSSFFGNLQFNTAVMRSFPYYFMAFIGIQMTHDIDLLLVDSSVYHQEFSIFENPQSQNFPFYVTRNKDGYLLNHSNSSSAGLRIWFQLSNFAYQQNNFEYQQIDNHVSVDRVIAGQNFFFLLQLFVPNTGLNLPSEVFAIKHIRYDDDFKAIIKFCTYRKTDNVFQVFVHENRLEHSSMMESDVNHEQSIENFLYILKNGYIFENVLYLTASNHIEMYSMVLSQDNNGTIPLSYSFTFMRTIQHKNVFICKNDAYQSSILNNWIKFEYIITMLVITFLLLFYVKPQPLEYSCRYSQIPLSDGRIILMKV